MAESRKIAPISELRGAARSIMFGGDPEFELVVNGKVVMSENVLSFAGQVGCDGSGEPVEFRPTPAREIHAVLTNIHTLFRRAYCGDIRREIDSQREFMLAEDDEYGDSEARMKPRSVALSVGGDSFAVGAHIHFGNAKLKAFADRAAAQIGETENSYGSDEDHGFMKDRVAHGSEAEKFLSVIDALDDFLGRRLIDLSGDARDDYRQMSTWRINKHGFEYRTLPAAIMKNPRACGLVYLVAKRVMEKLATTGLEYERDDEKGATPEALAALIGKRNASALEKFIREYPRGKGTVDKAAWLDRERVMDIGRRMVAALPSR
jgi:hypothetical protein